MDLKISILFATFQKSCAKHPLRIYVAKIVWFHLFERWKKVDKKNEINLQVLSKYISIIIIIYNANKKRNFTKQRTSFLKGGF